MKATLILISTFFFSLSLLADVPYKRQESDQIKEIFTNWEATKGEWLYASLDALVMNTEFPKRPEGVVETPFELISTMDVARKNRVLEASKAALEKERKGSKSSQGGFYWSVWGAYFSRASCQMSQGRSNGDPHIQTFDGEKHINVNSAHRLPLNNCKCLHPFLHCFFIFSFSSY
jgi:hypothetical protein